MGYDCQCDFISSVQIRTIHFIENDLKSRQQCVLRKLFKVLHVNMKLTVAPECF